MAYVYTLQDLYKIYQQTDDKVAQLKEFQSLNLEYNINWENLISAHTTPKKVKTPDEMGA